MTAPKSPAHQKTDDQPVPEQAETDQPTVALPFTDTLTENPEWAYLFDGRLPVRPATEAELAEYARRLDDPHWADIYHPDGAWEQAADSADLTPAGAAS